jgi:hypothetical protein
LIYSEDASTPLRTEERPRQYGKSETPVSAAR